MALPVDSARNTNSIASASNNHDIATASPTSGTLLIVLIRFTGAPGTITATGYTQLATDQSDSSDDTTQVYYRQADGSEGATDTFTSVISIKDASIVWKITGAADPATRAPEISSVVVGTTTANTANPGSRAVTGGPKDVLYIAMMGLDGATKAPTVAPTNYTNLVTSTVTGGATATQGAVGGASRQVLASSSDDPGVFTHPAANTGWTAFTVVVHANPILLKSGYGRENAT